MRLFDDLGVKALSLALAALLWFVIAGEKTSEMGVSVPVELQNFPKDLELTGEPVNTIELRLRASPGVMQQLGPRELSAQIDLAGVDEGERIVHLTEASIRVPFGVKVVKITPAILNLHFERTLQKLVPVRPRLIGRPATGFEVAEVTATPAEVRIAGPRSRVNDVESAFTEPVSVDAAREPVVEEVTLGLEDPVLRIQGSPRVRVSARIREVHEKRAFVLGVELRGGQGSLRPPSVRVVLSGPAGALRQLDATSLRAYVAAPPAGAPRAEVAVELPAGTRDFSVESIEPEMVAWRPARRP